LKLEIKKNSKRHEEKKTTSLFFLLFPELHFLLHLLFSVDHVGCGQEWRCEGVGQTDAVGFLKFQTTLLHYACSEGDSSPVIPLLLAHPDIDVNSKDTSERTPFFWACDGRTSCVRELLKDSRVKVNEPDYGGCTPLWGAARYDYLDVIKWWIASGREMDLGKPGDYQTDAIGMAKEQGNSEVVTLLRRFKKKPVKTRHAMKVELGFVDDLAAEMFATVVFVSDGLLQIIDTKTATPAARFFNIAKSLPLELQMVLCHNQVGSAKEIVPGKHSEVAFKELARRLW